MRAALVTEFGRPPHIEDVSDPVATTEHEILLDVLAAGLHRRVLSQADGSHYSSTGALPLVPGVDGVGRDGDGHLRYFVTHNDGGAMAERAVVDVRRTAVLPDDADPVAIAAAMNPAMSSWVALRRRIAMPSGQRVMMLGATGNAGRMAVQVARLLGASDITAVGRHADLLAEVVALGADRAVQLDDTEALAEAGRAVDVVLDYLWGAPTAAAMRAIVPHRADDTQPLTWVQIGSVAGPESSIPSAALRACRLTVVGSGQGSVATEEIVAELPAIAAEITSGALAVDAVPVPLDDVGRAWADAPTSRRRLVITPTAAAL